MNIPYFELRDFPSGINGKVQKQMIHVYTSKLFIFGKELRRFEDRFSELLGVKHCIGVGNGFDALKLAMMSYGIGEGDEVIINANSIPVTIQAIIDVGATPVLADFNELTGQLNLGRLEKLFGSKTRAVLPVHLYHSSTNMITLKKLCDTHNLILIEDFAHVHGGKYDDKALGSYGHVGATSFYPTKILGTVGDAGAVVTNDDIVADKVRALRNYGKVHASGYEYPGINSRMDEIHAGVLNVRLNYLREFIDARQKIMDRYKLELSDNSFVLPEDSCSEPTHHIAALRSDRQEDLNSYLNERGIGTAVHYPFNDTDYFWKKVKCESWLRDKVKANAQSLLSLPIYPGLTVDEQTYIIEAVKSFFKELY